MLVDPELFGPSYAMMPFLGEPYATWIEHSQGIWFRLMGDGHREDRRVCRDRMAACATRRLSCSTAARNSDSATSANMAAASLSNGTEKSTSKDFYRQGDGDVARYDWFIGATAGGLILESERLLVRHDAAAAQRNGFRTGARRRISRFAPRPRDAVAQRRAWRRICSRRLTPARQPDGRIGQAYLTELSVNYVAGLERLAEVSSVWPKPAKPNATGHGRQSPASFAAPDDAGRLFRHVRRPRRHAARSFWCGETRLFRGDAEP